MSFDPDHTADRSSRLSWVRPRWQVARDDPRIVVLALAALALAAGVYWYRGASSVPAAPAPQTEARPAGAPPTAGGDLATTTSTATTVVVHVAGAVARPGIVVVPNGARVVDAIDAAGGPVPDADLDRLNLAARVRDGDRVLVARAGDPPGPSITNDVPGSSPDGTATSPLDLNNATAADLEALPGIGPTLAAAIIAERDRRGGFGSVDDLRSVRGIGDQRFADLRELVTV
jgi:competence protein ComEA